MKERGRPEPAPAAPQTLTKAANGIRVPTPADRVTGPRWTGCPYGCPGGRHEHDDWPPNVAGCNYCLALDWSARESLHDCSTVCPLQAVAS